MHPAAEAGRLLASASVRAVDKVLSQVPAQVFPNEIAGVSSSDSVAALGVLGSSSLMTTFWADAATTLPRSDILATHQLQTPFAGANTIHRKDLK